MHKFIIPLACALALSATWALSPASATDVKEKAVETKDTIKEKAVDAKDTVKEKAVEAKDTIKDKAQHVKDKITGKMHRRRRASTDDALDGVASGKEP